ncbi:MAG TPA: PEP-utilizing enzyme [Candidatus Saccharimonadales bacterium]|nr:PEP-utilizing enzyme [Candidatus Saccharimonadales bacterium]
MQSDLTRFYEKQISLTEWFEAIGHPQAKQLKVEDNDKRERLNVLSRIIGLPFDKPTQFSAQDVAARTPEFKTFLRDHGAELCAVRLIPDDPALPKLRMRGHSITDGTKWFDEQAVDASHYRVDFVPHSDSVWATIFVVSHEGIFGELTKGEHNELTQGLYKEHEPITFQFDFNDWQLSRDEPGAKEHLADIIAHLKVTDPAKRDQIKNELDGTFEHDYLAGYFETTASDDRGIWFIDYNRLLGDMYANAAPTADPDALVTGRCGSPGTAAGTVVVVAPDQLQTATLTENDILVCAMTSPDYLPLMQKAAAIVTDLGGVLSHAAIIARELKKPCVTGTKNGTSTLEQGQHVIVKADKGAIYAA